MVQSKGKLANKGGGTEVEGPEASFRERLELILFLAVEVICILLFVDFLFIGYYVK